MDNDVGTWAQDAVLLAEALAILGIVLTGCFIAIVLARKPKLFESDWQRDTTIFMFLSFALLLVLLTMFGDKVSKETLGGILIGAAQAFGAIGGYLWGKQEVKKAAEKAEAETK